MTRLPWTITILYPRGGGTCLWPEGKYGTTFVTNLRARRGVYTGVPPHGYDVHDMRPPGALPPEMMGGWGRMIEAGETVEIEGNLINDSSKEHREALAFAVELGSLEIKNLFRGRLWRWVNESWLEAK